MRAIIFRFPISKPVNETNAIGLHLLYLLIALISYSYQPNTTNLDLQSYSKMNYVNTSEHLNQTV